MNKQLFWAAILIVFGAFFVFAQHTGSDLERKPADNLYPAPGPGELMIVDQLKETNHLLQEQSRLLSEQNRLLAKTLEEIKKRDTETKHNQK